MNIEFTNEEVVFVYGMVKKELTTMKSQNNIRYSKSDLKLYENLITKFEEAYPALNHLSL